MNESAQAKDGSTIRDWLRLLRPQQWVKNAFVLTPLLFSGHLATGGALLHALAAFAVFCGLASAVYAFNDVAEGTYSPAPLVSEQTPYICVRIPTGGGKTEGCHATHQTKKASTRQGRESLVGHVASRPTAQNAGGWHRMPAGYSDITDLSTISSHKTEASHLVTGW